MGLYNILKKGASALKGREPSPAETTNKLKFEQSVYEEREKGRLEGAKKRAKEEGFKSGYGSSGGKMGKVGGALNRLDSGARAVSYGLNNAEKLFGVGGGPNIGKFGSGGSGLDFGLGIGQEQRQEPRRITKVNPRTGAVTIIETGGDIGQPNKPKKRKSGVHNFFDDLDEYNPF